MLWMAVHSASGAERALLEETLRTLLAADSGEAAELRCCRTLDELEGWMEQSDALDLACMDMVQDGAIAVAERLRRRHREAMLILIVDPKLSPARYIRPTILAAALLPRPIQAAEARETLREVLLAARGREGDGDERFVFSAGGETYRIPFGQIFYFESREKKIFLRTQHREYGFYETMEHLQNTLPGDFLRCHKSYIVNTAFLRGVSLSKSQVLLREDISIPVSRTYKDAVRGWSAGERT